MCVIHNVSSLVATVKSVHYTPSTAKIFNYPTSEFIIEYNTLHALFGSKMIIEIIDSLINIAESIYRKGIIIQWNISAYAYL